MMREIDAQIVERFEYAQALLKKQGMTVRPNGRHFDVRGPKMDMLVFTGNVDLILGFAKGLEHAAKKKRKAPRRKK